MPRVLVLMPIYNAAPYVRRALDSILAQTFTDFVLLVIDDGSTDASGEVIGSVDDLRVGKAGYRFHETLDPPQTARLGDGQLDQSAIVLELEQGLALVIAQVVRADLEDDSVWAIGPGLFAEELDPTPVAVITGPGVDHGDAAVVSRLSQPLADQGGELLSIADSVTHRERVAEEQDHAPRRRVRLRTAKTQGVGREPHPELGRDPPAHEAPLQAFAVNRVVNRERRPDVADGDKPTDHQFTGQQRQGAGDG